MWGFFDLEKKRELLEELEEQIEAPSFWEDSSAAQTIFENAKKLREWIVPVDELEKGIEEVTALTKEKELMGDEMLRQEIALEACRLEEKLEKLEFRRMLAGEFDEKNCYFTINAGAGGTEACDWVGMLGRMYKYWMEGRGWKVEELEATAGDGAGFKSITYLVKGDYVYGYCRSEKGVHRLVRISPFDSNARRHTSFAAVDITPEFDDDDAQIVLNPDELRIDTYRSQGAGGQHVNTTDSAVRITHLPTNTVVTCQNERSQHKNKESCLKMLKSKLFELERSKKMEKIQALKGVQKENAWGSQIRSYVLDDRRVKDTRTGVETRNVEAVLDRGELDPFVLSYLKQFGAEQEVAG